MFVLCARSCISDCNTALELLQPALARLDNAQAGPEEAAGTKKLLIRLLVRRAQARVQVSELEEAVLDYEQAVRYDK